MRQFVGQIAITTPGQGLHDITGAVEAWLAAHPTGTGLLTLFCRHSSASLLIQENADPTARADLEAYFRRIAPEDGPYRHRSEGPDDMPAHLRAALTDTQVAIPIGDGRLLLGIWQGIYLFEHRATSHHRSVALHLLSTPA